MTGNPNSSNSGDKSPTSPSIDQQSNGPRIFQIRRDIVNLSQGEDPVAVYYTKLKSLSEELNQYRPLFICGQKDCEAIKKINSYFQTEHTMNFLMGLNDSFSQIRSQILVMDPLPPINIVFALLIQEEKQRKISHVGNQSPIVFSNQPNAFKGGVRKDRPFCTHCKFQGHTVDKCYKLHGYPSGYKIKTRNESQPVNAVNAVPSVSYENVNNMMQKFSDDQCHLSNRLCASFPSSSGTDFDLAGQVVDETRPKEDLTTLKILSYNVWFAEDIELRIRMRAIGDIIQLHSPNVICLQEVTPDIYAILQRSEWWKSYKCSLSFDKLSKLPVKSYSCKQFSYSAMGRELCIAEVLVGPTDKPLVVATTHLESPCPAPPKWDQMYSKERVKQANEAVHFLKKNPNAIFCGDMNWDDKLDGEFPLPNGWIDVWTELKPKETGWTYDTKSNLMLSANRKLQKRLDRFVVSLRDFRVEEIKMVGTEPIPEATYLKQKKGGKELELPVLPSDHFGLLLTISER